MAPAMAFCLGGAALLSSPEFTSVSPGEGGTNQFWDAVVLTNPSFAAYIPGDSHSEHNQAVRAVNYPIRGEPVSVLSSISFWTTNKTIR